MTWSKESSYVMDSSLLCFWVSAFIYLNFYNLIYMYIPITYECAFLVRKVQHDYKIFLNTRKYVWEYDDLYDVSNSIIY